MALIKAGEYEEADAFAKVVLATNYKLHIWALTLEKLCQALCLLERVLEVCVKVLGEQHLRVASALNDIAVVHQV